MLRVRPQLRQEQCPYKDLNMWCKRANRRQDRVNITSCAVRPPEGQSVWLRFFFEPGEEIFAAGFQEVVDRFANKKREQRRTSRRRRVPARQRTQHVENVTF